ncbi:hypothetical protein QBC34DRAFT_419280 [Podospora aff. communis PSN243]|uniref:Uncharacterized protein n=1 Tax=Podospora aff. communis PSN243 TaxID=3040156 RepID=A0AAV9FYH6_9PEZI|nr:hypothetical protein QBC34DRAFT_419280 [Podospora aff. communis PSN243]
MDATPRFLLLPRELRDQIYAEYLAIGAEGGYVYDFSTGKLRCAGSRQPIDLSLMYACRQIASEMSRLPLRLATVTFSSLYSEDLSVRAGRFNYFMWELEQVHRYLMELVDRTLISSAKADIIRRYPEMQWWLNWLLGIDRHILLFYPKVALTHPSHPLHP